MSASAHRRQRADSPDTPIKRRKVEPEEIGGTGIPASVAAVDLDVGERCKELWFEDGSIIVAARGMAFRVHASVLALRSDVFKTRLSGAAVGEHAERLEGCPVLRVKDRGRDLQDLLHVIYDGGRSKWFSRQPVEYATFRAVTSLAVKYDFHDIIEEAKYRLSCVFPTDDVNSWDPYLRPDGDGTLIRLDERDCIDLIRIVRLLGMQIILPLVFYESCNIVPYDAPKGRDYGDGRGPATLKKKDVRTYIQGRHALIEDCQRGLRVFQELAADSSTRFSGCTTRSHCQQSFLQLSLRALDDQLYACAESIAPMTDWLASHTLDAQARPCTGCLSVLKTLVEARRAEAWRNLGKIFSVPQWPAGKHQDSGVPAAAP